MFCNSNNKSTTWTKCPSNERRNVMHESKKYYISVFIQLARQNDVKDNNFIPLAMHSQKKKQRPTRTFFFLSLLESFAADIDNDDECSVSCYENDTMVWIIGQRYFSCMHKSGRGATIKCSRNRINFFRLHQNDLLYFLPPCLLNGMFWLAFEL